jgi:predicted metal-binding membrane protein
LDAARRSALARFGADRLLIVTCLVLLTLLAWAYLWLLAARMSQGDMSLMGMASMPMGAAMPSSAPMPLTWTAATFWLMALMWWVMMIGMMVPSAMPAILLHARVQRHHRSDAAQALRLSLSFAAGYLVAWAVFSLIATTAQWGLTEVGQLAPMTMSVGTRLGAVLFGLAGLYQLSPLKSACLRHCRSPAEFLSTHHRPGWSGAMVTGFHHGLYCVGCCWLLMALLFAGGVMNLLWVLVIALFVLVEKLFPQGGWIARISGALMLAAAAWLLVLP